MSVINKDLPNTASEMGQFVGKGIGLILIPLIVMRISDYAGWGLFFAIAFGYSYGELNKPGIEREKRNSIYSNVTYQAPGCEFFVKFPGQPQIKQFTHPSIGEYEQAHWGRTTGTESVSLRTECMNMPEKQNEISEIDAEKAINKILTKYPRIEALLSAFDSVSNPEGSNYGVISKAYKIKYDTSLLNKLGYKSFDGHTTRLGQYFRNLFHILKYTENIEVKYLSGDDKYQIIKSLRSQLSCYEQILIYYNSLSLYGRPLRKIGIIGQYQLIKNIPIPLVEFSGNIHDFYSEIEFEWDEIISRAEGSE